MKQQEQLVYQPAPLGLKIKLRIKAQSSNDTKTVSLLTSVICVPKNKTQAHFKSMDSYSCCLIIESGINTCIELCVKKLYNNILGISTYLKILIVYKIFLDYCFHHKNTYQILCISKINSKAQTFKQFQLHFFFNFYLCCF